MTQRAIRAADLFCGSGGFSTGLVRACEQIFPGRLLDLVAVNHWQVAIDTHQVNHPGVRHFCADLEHLKPLDAVPGGVLDILLAAPACTYHSRARGGKPVYDQQRMDPWHVVRWCTELRVHRLIVENVPEFIDWGPCDVRTGKPIKKRRGEYFRAWVNALKAIGMRGEWKVLTCANFGDATTRERFFYYARSDKKALRWPEPTHTRGGSTDLLGTLLPWRAAAEIIDWSRPGTSIFTRKRALVRNTLSRLLAGAKRNHWPQQHIDALQALIEGRTPRTRIEFWEAEMIAQQLGVPLVMATGSGGTARGVDRPIPSVTTGGHNGATPHFAEPIIVNRHTSDFGIGARGTHEPIPTVTTHGAGWLARPMILPKCTSTGGNPVLDPLQTIVTGGAGALVQPIIAPYYGGGSGLTAKGVDEPLPAQGTKDRFSIATPVVMRAGHGGDARKNPAAHVMKRGAPLPAITGGNEIGVASPTIFRVNQGAGRQRGITSGNEPVPTLTASESLGLATPALIRAGHGDDGHSIGSRVLDDGAPLPSITGSNEVGVATPFLVPNFGERHGQTPRTHDIADPAPTIAASGHIQLAQPFIAPCTHHDTSDRSRDVGQPVPTITTANRGELTLATPAITDTYYIDILYRMLHWSELARATSFIDEDRTYHFTGTSTEITKQIGNAVPIRTGSALCAALLAA